MAGSALVAGWPLCLSMRKACKLRWQSCADSYESMFHATQDLARLKVTPPIKADKFIE
ncbi:hypothetical protein M433DRAFT_318094 [Acidomyces richmondensis BFW]|nr:MAG: hypothetical protein FE78DRAFT_88344 [Acidomyces sp. 'richmondensis']KYG49395.1 hypothetical protein M433DRAFT_318094 [Acidomyces richmondensis BFW]